MSHIFLVRHGPTHAKGLVGWTDLPADLSDTAAITRLSAALPRDALVISSDLIRCVATADAIQGDRKRLSHCDQLRELHFGAWENKTVAEVQDTHAELSRDYWTNPGDVSPPGGESWNDAKDRVSARIDGLLADHPTTDLIVVAHFGAILTQVQRAAKMSARAAMAFKIDNLSVTKLEHSAGFWRVLGVNHLN